MNLYKLYELFKKKIFYSLIYRDLRFNELTELPREIGNLSNLQELYVFIIYYIFIINYQINNDINNKISFTIL